MLFPIADEIQSIIDIGPGAGQWYDLIRPWFPHTAFNALEIFEPYVERYQLRKKYDAVVIGDARNGWEGLPPPPFDLVIFGDVLEHMSHDEAEKVVSNWLHRWALVSIPIGPCPQEPTEENPYEEHRSTWEVADVLQRFPVKGPYFVKIPPGEPGRGVFLLESK